MQCNYLQFDFVLTDPKPFTDRKGVKGQEARYSASQPLLFGTAYNKRKLHNLPFHRTMAGECDLLKEECLYNFNFMLRKMNESNQR
jgi:hypothetical protein